MYVCILLICYHAQYELMEIDYYVLLTYICTFIHTYIHTYIHTKRTDHSLVATIYSSHFSLSVVDELRPDEDCDGSIRR